MKLFEELTAVAEATLLGSQAITLESLLRTSPPPKGPFSVVAMGKFGGNELTYHSDLDVIFFYDDPEDQEFYTRLATRIISDLTLLTRNGYAYKIDTNLRPSGNAGALVTSVSSFREYHRSIGQTWERQALIKARPVIGSEDFCSELQALFQGISFAPSNAQSVAREIDHLRGRMEREIAREREGLFNLKTGYGGIVDIEFIVQYLQIVHGLDHPKLRIPNTISALRALRESAFLLPPLAQELENAYFFLRGLETRLRLFLDQSTDELMEGRDAMKELERLYYREPILPRLLATRESVRTIYKRIFLET